MCVCFFKTCTIVAILFSWVMYLMMYLSVVTYLYPLSEEEKKRKIEGIRGKGAFKLLCVLFIFPIEAIYGVLANKPARITHHLLAQFICLAFYIGAVVKAYHEGLAQPEPPAQIYLYGIIAGISFLLFVITYKYYQRLKRKNSQPVSQYASAPLTLDHNPTVIPMHAPAYVARA